MNEKENLEQKNHLEINSPVKKDGSKFNIKGIKKYNSDTSLILNNNEIKDEKDKTYSIVKKTSNFKYQILN